MPVSELIYDNWGNTKVIDRTYEEVPARYEIENSAGTVIVEEPIGWGSIPFIHTRDKDFHGFNYELLGGDIQLKFDCDSGMPEIMAEYALSGSDGVVAFRKVMELSSGDFIEYEGVLNLNSLKRASYTIECMVERRSLHQQISSRISTKVNLESDTDLDNNPQANYAPQFLVLPGQMLSEKFESARNVARQEEFMEARTGDATAYAFFDFDQPIVNTIKGYKGSILGVSGDDEGLLNGNHDLFKFTADGKFKIDINVEFQVNLRITPRIVGINKKVSQAWIYFQLIINSGSGKPQQRFTIAQVPEFNPGVKGFVYPRVNGAASYDLEVEAGDSMIIVATIRYGHNANKLKSVNITLTQFKATLKIEGTSRSQSSFSPARLIKPCMDALFTRVTGRENVVRSDFYSRADETHAVDGCGANRVLLNGGALRLAPTTMFPLTTTIREMLDSMNAIDCIGMGYEWDAEDKREIIRIEPADYFYRDVEVIDLGQVHDYQEETAKDLIYNKITVGYDKYRSEAENSLDEVHAVHEYATPIRTEANEYIIQSKYNASGYLVETTRRVQFEGNEDKATSFDDDIFIVHVQDDGTGSDVFFEPVTDEPFAEISGILSPDTTINLTITPKRMLMAHSRWLASSLIRKEPSSLIKNTFTKQNKTLSTTLSEGYCTRGDEERLPLRAADDVILSAFNNDNGIYSPEWVNFKARLPMSSVRYIINAHRGLDLDGKNYGYITFTDDQGVVCRGWLIGLTYSRDEENVTFRLLKKKFP